MLIDATALKHIFIVCGKTDLRKGIDGLAAFVIEEYDLDVYDQALFLFCGTKKDRFKALYWDQNGFVLMYKRFESGYLQWPRSRKEVLQLNPLLLERLLTGLSIEEKCTLKETKKGAIHYTKTLLNQGFCLFFVVIKWYNRCKKIARMVV